MSGAPGNFSPRISKIPPDKGSFPIDHDHACRDFMINFLKCLKTNYFDNESCRAYSQDYLRCRMENGLMAKEDWDKLGFGDLKKKSDAT